MTLTVQDVAKIFGVAERTVYRWIKQNAIPVYQVSDQYRFSRSELLEWATRNRIEATPALLDEKETRDSPPPSLGDSLAQGGIFYRVEGRDRAEVLCHVVGMIPLPEEADRNLFLEALVLREELASTGVGGGIAVPHVRGPIVLPISIPSVSLCFLDKPVDFQALDGRPVGTLFVVLSPTVRSHLQLLAKLTFALRDDGLKVLLDQQASRETILSHMRQLDRRIQNAAPADGAHCTR